MFFDTKTVVLAIILLLAGFPDGNVTVRVNISLSILSVMKSKALQGAPRLISDAWEPIPPSEIRTEQHMLSYLSAFLGHFGPQHTVIDIPLRLFLKSLSGSWPTTGPFLAEWATKRSHQFIVMFEVLYLVSSIRHRRILVEAVQVSVTSTNLHLTI
ncbi:unnamed protein product [Angiostrongylus costaricensis]|uniref:Secreted protein n=1 Tax=Angiostrongylus costaricensis TaxID=334426 RepID=A0A0R3PWU1_ANGCS|nr:unnamed protein product [Angiostrongylus costaricensis]